jgi:hypothetical protein
MLSTVDMAERRRAKNTAAQGRDLELAVMALFTERGWAGVMRSAGSHGAVDVVAFPDYTLPGPEGGRERFNAQRLVLVQCKLTNAQIAPADRQILTSLALRACALPLVATRVDPADGRRGAGTRVQYRKDTAMWIGFRELTGPGPKDWRAWFPPEGVTDGE